MVNVRLARVRLADGPLDALDLPPLDVLGEFGAGAVGGFREPVEFGREADLAAAMAELRAEMQALRGEMQGELRGEMQGLRGELCAEIQAAKADIIKWLVPLLLGQAALIAALVRLLRARDTSVYLDGDAT